MAACIGMQFKSSLFMARPSACMTCRFRSLDHAKNHAQEEASSLACSHSHRIILSARITFKSSENKMGKKSPKFFRQQPDGRTESSLIPTNLTNLFSFASFFLERESERENIFLLQICCSEMYLACCCWFSKRESLFFFFLSFLLFFSSLFVSLVL